VATTHDELDKDVLIRKRPLLKAEPLYNFWNLRVPEDAEEQAAIVASRPSAALGGPNLLVAGAEGSEGPPVYF
jgi:hypothetical protein